MRDIEGKTLTVGLDSNDSISYLKAQIDENLDIKPESQRLVFEDRQL